MYVHVYVFLYGNLNKLSFSTRIFGFWVPGSGFLEKCQTPHGGPKTERRVLRFCNRKPTLLQSFFSGTWFEVEFGFRVV